ncbi:MAG: DUF4386 domain-containing protein [Candidatus Limnocylindrales bacterium]
MNDSRRHAVAAGVLLLIADMAGVLNVALSHVLRDSPNFIGMVPDHSTELGLAALFVFAMGAAGAGVSVALYPVLRQLNPTLAIGAVVFRTAEGVIWMVCAGILMSIVSLGQRAAGAADPAWYGNASRLLLDGTDQINLAGLLVFSLGALCYYYAFFRSRVLPRWLSGWGLLGTALWIGGVTWAMVAHSQDYSLFVAPLGLQELVFAFWLILRGFSAPKLAATPNSAVASAPIAA